MSETELLNAAAIRGATPAFDERDGLAAGRPLPRDSDAERSAAEPEAGAAAPPSITRVRVHLPYEMVACDLVDERGKTVDTAFRSLVPGPPASGFGMQRAKIDVGGAPFDVIVYTSGITHPRGTVTRWLVGLGAVLIGLLILGAAAAIR